MEGDMSNGFFTRPIGILVLIVVAAVIFSTPSFTGSSEEISFQPAVLPVKITWSNGQIDIEGERSILTPIGKIEIGANLPLPALHDKSFYVILRNKQESIDNVYRVNSETGVFHAVVDGTTDIQVDDQRVIIEVTSGTIKTVEFKQSRPPSQASSDSSGITYKWSKFWRDTFHTPFSWSRWAYDDSTMGDWPPLGFLWFLVRLLGALILGIIDLILLVVQFIAAVAFVIGGTLAMNIIYGISAGIAILLLLMGSFTLMSGL